MKRGREKGEEKKEENGCVGAAAGDEDRRIVWIYIYLNIYKYKCVDKYRYIYGRKWSDG